MPSPSQLVLIHEASQLVVEAVTRAASRTGHGVAKEAIAEALSGLNNVGSDGASLFVEKAGPAIASLIRGYAQEWREAPVKSAADSSAVIASILDVSSALIASAAGGVSLGADGKKGIADEDWLNLWQTTVEVLHARLEHAVVDDLPAPLPEELGLVNCLHALVMTTAKVMRQPRAFSSGGWRKVLLQSDGKALLETPLFDDSAAFDGQAGGSKDDPSSSSSRNETSLEDDDEDEDDESEVGKKDGKRDTKPQSLLRPIALQKIAELRLPAFDSKLTFVTRYLDRVASRALRHAATAANAINAADLAGVGLLRMLQFQHELLRQPGSGESTARPINQVFGLFSQALFSCLSAATRLALTGLPASQSKVEGLLQEAEATLHYLTSLSYQYRTTTVAADHGAGKKSRDELVSLLRAAGHLPFAFAAPILAVAKSWMSAVVAASKDKASGGKKKSSKKDRDGEPSEPSPSSSSPTFVVAGVSPSAAQEILMELTASIQSLCAAGAHLLASVSALEQQEGGSAGAADVAPFADLLATFSAAAPPPSPFDPKGSVLLEQFNACCCAGKAELQDDLLASVYFGAWSSVPLEPVPVGAGGKTVMLVPETVKAAIQERALAPILVAAKAVTNSSPSFLSHTVDAAVCAFAFASISASSSAALAPSAFSPLPVFKACLPSLLAALRQGPRYSPTMQGVIVAAVRRVIGAADSAVQFLSAAASDTEPLLATLKLDATLAPLLNDSLGAEVYSCFLQQRGAESAAVRSLLSAAAGEFSAADAVGTTTSADELAQPFALLSHLAASDSEDKVKPLDESVSHLVLETAAQVAMVLLRSGNTGLAASSPVRRLVALLALALQAGFPLIRLNQPLLTVLKTIKGEEAVVEAPEAKEEKKEEREADPAPKPSDSGSPKKKGVSFAGLGEDDDDDNDDEGGGAPAPHLRRGRGGGGAAHEDNEGDDDEDEDEDEGDGGRLAQLTIGSAALLAQLAPKLRTSSEQLTSALRSRLLPLLSAPRPAAIFEEDGVVDAISGDLLKALQ